MRSGQIPVPKYKLVAFSVQRVPHLFGMKMEKTIKKEVDIELVNKLAEKIFETLDESPLIEVLLAIANVFVQVHVQEGLDIDMALDAIKRIHEQALEDDNRINEIH